MSLSRAPAEYCRETASCAGKFRAGGGCTLIANSLSCACIVNLSDFTYDPDERVHAAAKKPPSVVYESANEMLLDLQSDRAVLTRITIDKLDVLMLRSDPAEDFTSPRS